MDIHTTRTLNSGGEMPLIGLGTWELTHSTREVIIEALRLGYPMIDTSGDYGTQPAIGRGIQDSGVSRDSVYIVTKIEEDDDALEATKRNLEELGVLYADLILIHRPPQDGIGSELWTGLIQAQKDGFTKDIGVSNYSSEQIQTLADETGVMPSVNQIEWSPFGYSLDMLDYCNDHGIIVQAYSPLTRSTLLGNDALEEVARHYGKTSAQLLIRWNLQLGTVPLPKANDVEHLKENIDVFDFEIDKEDMAYLCSFNETYSALGTKLSYV